MATIVEIYPVRDLIPVDTPTKLEPNEITAVPSAANQITWQSTAGSELFASVDGTIFGTLGLSLANEPKTVFTSAAYVRVATANTFIICKVAPISALSPPTGGGGGGTGAALHPDGTSALPGIAFTNEPDLGFWRPALGVTSFVNAGISEFSINGNTHVVALQNLSVLTRIAIGSIPALSGALRFENAAMIMARNFANTADIPMLGTTVNNEIVFGGPSTTNIFNGDTIFNNTVTLGPDTWLTAKERLAPPAPPVDTAYLWLQDTGSGFSQLMIQFRTGPPVAIATEGQNYISVGNLPAQSGAIRLENNAMIMSRDPTNTFDIPLIGTNIAGDVIIGAPGGNTIIQGDTNISGDITIEGDIITIGGTTLFKDGTISAPSIAFENEPGMGFFRPGNRQMSWVSAGSVIFTFNGNTATTGAYNFYATNSDIYNILSIGNIGTSATAGTIRLPYGFSILGRDADQLGNIPILKTSAANVITLGASTSTTTYVEGANLRLRSASNPVFVDAIALSIGTNPAQVGTLRMPSDGAIRWRNSSNSGDVFGLNVDVNNNIILGHNNGYPLYLDGTNIYARNTGLFCFVGGPTTWGAIPATVGTLRLTIGNQITVRNGSNTGDLNIVTTDPGNNIIFGGAGGTTYIDGDTVQFRPTSGIVSIPGFPANCFLAVGSTPASAGAIRMSNNGAIVARHSNNAADVNLLCLVPDNRVVIGGVTGDAGDIAVWLRTTLEFRDVITPGGPNPDPVSTFMFTQTIGGKRQLCVRFGPTLQTYVLASEV